MSNWKEQIRTELFNSKELPASVLRSIKEKSWWHIWVPENFGGLGLSLTQGLKLLYELSETDGSLGWTVTLCSGSNYFSRNITPEVAHKLFVDPAVCFGGSGMIAGKAEETPEGFMVNGTWKYATGAPHLTHFTLNAHLHQNGVPLFDENNNPQFISLFVPAEKVEVIPTWNTMGLIATSSHDFKIEQQLVPKEHSFRYDHFYGNDILDKIPFVVFADLTLIVNYLGMAKHFATAGLKIKELNSLTNLQSYVIDRTEKILSYAQQLEEILTHESTFQESLTTDIHTDCEQIVLNLSSKINSIFPQLGMKGASIDEEINQIYRDFFTATQHKHFRVTQP